MGIQGVLLPVCSALVCLPLESVLAVMWRLQRAMAMEGDRGSSSFPMETMGNTWASTGEVEEDI